MIKVACAIVRHNSLYFACQRPPGKSQALMWEFPGGKIEAQESAEQALHRELSEELLWQVKIEVALQPVEWIYRSPQEMQLTLYPFLCSVLNGDQPTLREHVQQAWLSLAELRQLELCAADRPILEQLQVLATPQ